MSANSSNAIPPQKRHWPTIVPQRETSGNFLPPRNVDRHRRATDYSERQFLADPLRVTHTTRRETGRALAASTGINSTTSDRSSLDRQCSTQEPLPKRQDSHRYHSSSAPQPAGLTASPSDDHPPLHAGGRDGVRCRPEGLAWARSPPAFRRWVVKPTADRTSWNNRQPHAKLHSQPAGAPGDFDTSRLAHLPGLTKSCGVRECAATFFPLCGGHTCPTVLLPPTPTPF